MKQIQNNKIKKQASFLSMTIILILSTTAVAAGPQQPDCWLPAAGDSLQPPQISMFDPSWIHFDDGTNVNAIGLNNGGTFEGAIRITPVELVDYDGYTLTAVRWHHGSSGGSTPPHSGTIKIYDAGTSTNPGGLITSEPFTVPSMGWFEIPLSTPVQIDVSKDVWVSVQVTHAVGEYPLGVDPGPVVPGKGGWISIDGVTWMQLGIDIPTLNCNWNIWAKVELFSEPPLKPQRPTGPMQGFTSVHYTYSTSTTDPEGDQIYYQWSWGDGSSSDWVGPYDSGATISELHAWDQAGTFEVTVKAKDSNNVESEWSDSLLVLISEAPNIEIGEITGGLFKAHAVIKNTGSIEITRVDWTFSLDGGLILLGKQSSGRVMSIPAGGEVTITSDVILGLGTTMITVTAEKPDVSSDAKQQEASVLLFFIKV